MSKFKKPTAFAEGKKVQILVDLDALLFAALESWGAEQEPPAMTPQEMISRALMEHFHANGYLIRGTHLDE